MRIHVKPEKARISLFKFVYSKSHFLWVAGMVIEWPSQNSWGALETHGRLWEDMCKGGIWYLQTRASNSFPSGFNIGHKYIVVVDG